MSAPGGSKGPAAPPSKSILDIICERTERDGPQQMDTAWIASNQINKLLAGSDVPFWKRVCTSGLLFKLHAPPTEANVHTLAQKIMSTFQATLEMKFGPDSADKIQVVEEGALTDTKLSLLCMTGVFQDCNVAEPIKWMKADGQYGTFVENEATMLPRTKVIAQLTAHETPTKVPIKYFHWEQTVIDINAKFDNDGTIVEKPVGPIFGYAVATEVTLTAHDLKLCVTTLKNAMDRYKKAVKKFQDRDRGSDLNKLQESIKGRFRGAFRGIKSANQSRKCRRRPKAQSGRTKTGLHGTGKAMAKTRSQGSKISSKKKGSVIRILKALKPKKGPNFTKVSLKTQLEARKANVEHLASMLWVWDNEFDKVMATPDLGFSKATEEKLIAITDEKDLFGDSKNAANHAPLVDVMAVSDNPDVFTKGGMIYALRVQEAIEGITYLVDTMHQRTTREYGYINAQGMCAQRMAIDVLSIMTNMDCHDSGAFPGWNSPFNGSLYTSFKDGTVLGLVGSNKRPAVRYVPKVLTRAQRVGVHVNACGSSFIGMEGDFIPQVSLGEQETKKTVDQAYQEVLTVTNRTARGGWLARSGDQMVEVEIATKARMRNPQQTGHLCLVETKADCYEFCGFQYGPEDVEAMIKYQNSGQCPPNQAELANLLFGQIYYPGDPFNDEPLTPFIIDEKTWKTIKERPLYGSKASATLKLGDKEATGMPLGEALLTTAKPIDEGQWDSTVGAGKASISKVSEYKKVGLKKVEKKKVEFKYVGSAKTAIKKMAQRALMKANAEKYSRMSEMGLMSSYPMSYYSGPMMPSHNLMETDEEVSIPGTSYGSPVVMTEKDGVDETI